MAHTIKLKRTSTAGNKPDNTNITTGELALNTADKSLYLQTGTANTDIITLYDDGILHLDDTNNRVGIGTTSPNKTVEIRYNTSNSDGRTGSGLAGGAAGAGLLIYNVNSTSGVFANLDFRAFNADGRIAYQYTGTENKGDFHFITDNTNSPESQMVIKNDGKVGIGTTSPSYHFHVDAGNNNSTALFESDGVANVVVSGGNNRGSFVVQHSGTTTGAVIAKDGGGLEFGVGANYASNVGMTLDSSGNLSTGQVTSDDKFTVSTSDWYQFTPGTMSASLGSYGMGNGNNSALRQLTFHVPNIAAYSNTGTVPSFGWYSNGGDLLMKLESSTGNLTVKGNIGTDSNSTVISTRKISARDTNGLAIATSNGTERIAVLNSGAVRFNDAFTFPTAVGSAGQVLKVPTSGTTLYWADEAAVSANTLISDTDGDTKIQVEESADEDKIRFDTAGTERAVMSANNTTFFQPVVLEEPSPHLILKDTTDDDDHAISFRDNLNNDAFKIDTGGDNFNFSAYGSREITFRTNNAEHMRLTGGGNVGIGTTSPTTKLEVHGTTTLKSQLDFLSPDGTDTISASMLNTDTLSFTGDSGQLFSITDSSGGTIFSVNDISGVPSIEVEDDGTIRLAETFGNVGIGVETPGEKLDVNGNVQADEFIGDLRGASLFKASAGEALSKGDVVYISGISGNTTVVSKADADDANKMPAFGIAAAAASVNNPVEVYTSGILSGIDTSSYSEGDELFVSTTAGILTSTAPAGESAALQKIGKVTRSHASSGSIFIIGAGRSNAVPNLDDGDIFIGNASNQAVSASLNTKIESYLDGGTSTPTFAGLATTADMTFGDNDKAIFGAGSDLQIYHDASHSFIKDSGTGHLKIQATNLKLQDVDGNNYIDCIDGSYVRLMHNTATKLETTSTGIDVTGDVVSDGLTVNGVAKITSAAPKLTFVESDTTDLNTRLRIAGGYFQYHTANDAEDTFTRRLQIDNSTGDISFYEDTGTTAKFHWDAADERLGIGTTSPDSLLEISSASATDFLKLTSTGSSASPIKLMFEKSGSEQGIIEYNRNGNLELYNTDPDGGVLISGSASASNDFYVNHAGKVGIGTSSPQGPLQVALSSTRNLVVDFDTEGDTRTSLRSIESTANNLRAIQIEGQEIVLGTAAYNQTVSAERMRIDSSGNVGIGTSDPATNLEIAGSAPKLRITDTRDQSFTVGDIMSSIEFDSDDTSGGAGSSSEPRAAINMYAASTFGSSTGLSFHTKSDISGYPTKQMVITNLGSVGIGTDSPSQKLDVDDGFIRVQSPDVGGIAPPVLTVGQINNAYQAGITSSIHLSMKAANSGGNFYWYPNSNNPIAILRQNGDFSLGSTNADNYVNTGSYFKPDASGKFLAVTGSAHGGFLMLESSTVTDNDQVGGVFFTASAGQSDAHRQVAGIDAIVDAHSTNTAVSGADLRFFTKNVGSGLADPRMTIRSSGQVGIGTTTPGVPLDVNGVIRAGAGDAGTSAYSITSNGGDLVLKAGADDVVLRTGGSGSEGIYFQDGAQDTKMFINAESGNVGIGTVGPNRQLHISGSGATIAAKIEATDGSQASVDLKNNEGEFRVISDGGELSIYDQTDTAERLRIDTAGLVGIGTNNPLYQLDVHTTTGTGLNVADDNGWATVRVDGGGGTDNVLELTNYGTTGSGSIIRTTGGGILRFAAANTEAMRISANGNIGVDKDDPQAKFQVEEYGIETTTTTTSAQTETTIDTFAAATFRSARYSIQVTNTTDSTYHMTEILLIHTGTAANITEYGTIFTGTAAEATFDADINSGNVRLRATPATTDSMTFKVVRHCITV